MPSDAVRKRCVDCKMIRKGSRGKMQWCDNCGGEMRVIPYTGRRKVRRG